MSARIFISYRREDSAGWVGRLVDDMGEHFGAENVFQDIHSIAPGSDFVDAINETLEVADCVLAVIGPNWLSGPDPKNRRIMHDGDYVRLELATALDRKLRVIPVLVGGAQMPGPDDLPESIRSLSRRNAAELSDRRWDYDIGRLVEVIRRTTGATPQSSTQVAESRRSVASVFSGPRRAALLGVLALGLPVLGLGAWLIYPAPPPDGEGVAVDAARRAGGWQRTGAHSVADVGAGVDARIWLVQADGGVAWTTDGRSFASIQAQGFARVAADRGGSAWGVGHNKTLWRFPADGAPHQMVRSPPVVDVAVSAKGRLWLVGDDASIWWTDDGQTFTRDARTSDFARIAAGPNETVVGVGRNATAWILRDSWVQIRPGGIADAAVAPNGSVWLLTADGRAERSEDGQRFAPVESAGFRSISVSRDGAVWAVGADGTLWLRPPGETSLGRISGPPSSTEAVTALVVFGSDNSLSAARPEVERARGAGFPSATIYRREGLYRSVIEFPTQQAANEALARARALSRSASDAYVRQVAAWCPNGTRSADGFKDCL
ncbi:TIR domain-containing protein [Sabulicella rubraurantiaca]|uniref:TIR domain-containing protein n=1 Tax=Sabulicella rubraurantiaca TaxID=2811429 RepID=UPI001A963009